MRFDSFVDAMRVRPMRLPFMQQERQVVQAVLEAAAERKRERLHVDLLVRALYEGGAAINHAWSLLSRAHEARTWSAYSHG